MSSQKPKKKYTPKPRPHLELMEIAPETKNQERAFDAFDDGLNLVMAGSPGTGKTFIALHMALEEVMDSESYYDRVIIVRSIVPTRDIGFLPGDERDKIDIYQLPYKSLCEELFNEKDAYETLQNDKVIVFETTSFIRGLTFDRAIIIVDEMQNMTGHELDSVITRMGTDSRIIFCGDYYQTDLTRRYERNGLKDFLTILDNSTYFKTIHFTWEDILRSDMARDYIMTKEMMKQRDDFNIDW